MDIYVDNNKLKKESTRMKECAEAIDEIILELVETTNELNEFWQGSDYNYFQQKIINDYQDNLKLYSKKLKEYAMYLEVATKAYQKLENIFKDKEIEV